MPGSISDSYPGPPICACGHFKELHFADFDNYPVLRKPGPCQGEGCTCQDFQLVDLAETELGKAMDAFILQVAAEQISTHDWMILNRLAHGAYLRPGECWTALEEPGHPTVSISTKAFERYREAGWIHEPEPGRWHITVQGRRALENHS